MNNAERATPWYRQLWPWLIMAPPFASVVGGLALAWAAISSNDGLVTPDYYRQGIEINERLTREEAANCAVKDRACLNAPRGGRPMKPAIWVLWPSFLIGAGVNAVFFSVFDPAELVAPGQPGTASALAASTVGFFAFWAIGACSSAFTCFLQRDAADVNRLSCPLPNSERPRGCRAPE